MHGTALRIGKRRNLGDVHVLGRSIAQAGSPTHCTVLGQGVEQRCVWRM